MMINVQCTKSVMLNMHGTNWYPYQQLVTNTKSSPFIYSWMEEETGVMQFVEVP